MSSPIQPSETAILGQWVNLAGRFVPDECAMRIDDLISNFLVRVAERDGGWTTLYRDPHDGRLWELTYDDSQSHGGGPPSLRILDPVQARIGYPGAHF